MKKSPYSTYSKQDISVTELTNDYRKELHIIVNRYIYHLKHYKNYGESHTDNVTNVLEDFVEYIHALYKCNRLPIKKITIHDIEGYIVTTSQRSINKSSRYFGINTKLHPSTVSGYACVVRCFFKYCNKLGVACIDHEAIESRKYERGKILILTEEEREIVFACPEKYEIRRDTQIRNKLFMYMLYYTGCRISEIINLKFSDIDLHHNQLEVRGKGGKLRGVFITDEIREMIYQYRQERVKPHIFRGRNVKDTYESENIFVCHAEQCYGKPCDIRIFQDMFAKYRKKMERKRPLTAHIFRHTFATELMKRGGDVRIVQIMLGHNFLETTMRYSHVSDEMLKTTHNLLCK